MAERFTSTQVQELTGITARQLQWWDERGIVVPARDGHRRLYSLEDLVEIEILRELRRRGFSLQRIRKVVRFLQRELKRRLVETVSRGSDYHLLTDGRHIFLEHSERGVIDVLKNARQPLLSVCLSDAVERVRSELAQLSSNTAAEKQVPARPAASASRKAGASRARRRWPDARSAFRLYTRRRYASQARVREPGKVVEHDR